MFKQALMGLTIFSTTMGNFVYAQNDSGAEPVQVAKVGTPFSSKTTQVVWEHHIHAWGNRDLEGIVSDYTDQSLLVVNGRSYVGKVEIRKVFTGLFNIFDHGNNAIDTPLVKDRVVYITWHFTPENESVFFGTDTFLIENGKISVQTIASPLYEVHPEIEGRF